MTLFDARELDLTTAGPVELVVRRDHGYKPKPKAEGKARRPPGCAVCGAGKHRPQHLGAPPSLNSGGSGMDRMEFQTLKGAWQSVFAEQIAAAGMARCESVVVEGQVGFPTRAARDEGNYRWMIEKALGDALVDAGVLDDDCFYPRRRYSFGNLEGVLDPGGSWLRLLLFASDREPPLAPGV